jgi:hypothetical protein
VSFTIAGANGHLQRPLASHVSVQGRGGRVTASAKPRFLRLLNSRVIPPDHRRFQQDDPPRNSRSMSQAVATLEAMNTQLLCICYISQYLLKGSIYAIIAVSSSFSFSMVHCRS